MLFFRLVAGKGRGFRRELSLRHGKLRKIRCEHQNCRSFRGGELCGAQYEHTVCCTVVVGAVLVGVVFAVVAVDFVLLGVVVGVVCIGLVVADSLFVVAVVAPCISPPVSTANRVQCCVCRV